MTEKSADAQRAQPTSSILNDPKFRGIVYQTVLVIAVVSLFWWLWGNAMQNLAAQNKAMGFGFLNQVSGFSISFTLIPFERTSPYIQVYFVGILNTLLVAAIGIVLATILGFLMGIARLSKNMLIRGFAAIYVEAIRNTPLLLQLIFWYFLALNALPAVRQSWEVPGGIIVNQRGISFPAPAFDGPFFLVVVLAIVAVVIVFGLRAWSIRTRNATGKIPAQIIAAAKATDVVVTLVVGAALAYLAQAALGFHFLPLTLLAAVGIAALTVLPHARLARLIQIALLTFAVGVPLMLAAIGALPAVVGEGFDALGTAIAGPFGLATEPGRLPIAQLLALALVVLAIWHVNRTVEVRARRNLRFPFSIGAVLIVGLPVLFYLLSGAQLTFDPPVLQGFNFTGGWTAPPELTALIFGLVVYTAAFIAEIVRAGIQAVNYGQTEAAASLGLRDNDRLRLVIIPQAQRIIVPPLTSQYLNLTKNSSLGAAIGFPELVNVFVGTALNQSGRAIEIIALTMLVYLTFSLATSLFMNWYNARIALVER